MVNKYIKIYLKRNVKLALFCAIVVSAPLFVVSLIYGAVLENVLVSLFVPFILAALVVGIASLYIIRFRKMIEKQEQIYGMTFKDTNSQHLETTLYLSDDWLIWAGSSAFYKKHIKSVKSVVRTGRAGSSNQVTIRTVDNKKYTIWCLSSSNINKIREWKRA